MVTAECVTACNSVEKTLHMHPSKSILIALLLTITCVHAVKKRIGIIGGGVSGLGAAHRLSSSPDHTVVVLEKGNEPVPLQHRVQTNGNTHDMDMIFIPNLNWEGFGVEARWRHLLESQQVELLPVDEFGVGGLYGESRMVNVFEEKEFQEYRTSFLETLSLEETYELYDEICRFITHFQDFYNENKYNGVQSCLNHGMAFRNESFSQWYHRNSYDMIGKFSSGLLALYGNLPVAHGPACQVLMMLSNKMPSILGPFLPMVFLQFTNHGIEPTSLTPKLPETAKLWLAGMMLEGRSTFMYSFKHGYASFFRKIIRNNRIDYRTNVDVSHIEYKDNQVLVHSTTGSTFTFDEIVVAARPEQALTFLPSSHPMTPLYQEAKNFIKQKMHTYGVYAVSIIAADVPDRVNGSLLDEPVSRLKNMNLTQYVMNLPDYLQPLSVDEIKNDTVNVMRIVKQFDNDNMLTVVWQSPLDMVQAKAEMESLHGLLQRLGYTNIKVAQMQHYPFTPTHLQPKAIDQGWYKRADKAQGVDHIHFVGEVFSGHGVPTVWLFSEDRMQKIFDLDSNEALHPFEPTSKMNSSASSVLNHLTPVGDDMQTTANDIFMSLLKRPVDAINMGIDPILLIDWTKEYGAIPFMFIWFLMSVCLSLRFVEYLLTKYFSEASHSSGIPQDKIKNVSIYCVELVLITALFFVAITGTWDLLTFQFPQRLLDTFNSFVIITVGINGLYICELFYHDQMRTSLKVHHFACLCMLQLMTVLYMEERQLVVLRMGLYNTIFALTEQNVFVTMLLHRLYPAFLYRFPSITKGSAYVYLVSRIAIGGMCFMAWYEFLSLPASTQASSLLSIRTLMTFVYPLLLLIQSSMQFVCFQSLIEVAKRYCPKFASKKLN